MKRGLGLIGIRFVVFYPSIGRLNRNSERIKN